MPRINLSLSAEHRLYILNVLFHYSKFVNGSAVIDTGSNGSSITQEVAEQLGISITSLPQKMISGVTGIKHVPIIETLDVVLPGTYRVQLKDVTILRKLEKQITKTSQGVKVSKGVMRAAVPNLLGLDFLRELKGTFVVNPTNAGAYLKW